MRVTRPLALLALAAGAVGLTPVTSSALPTEKVTITLTLTGADHYGATATVAGGTATEKFNITIARVTSSVVPTTKACPVANTCTIAGDAAADPNLPAQFVVHVVGGKLDTFDNVFDAYVQTTTCVSDTQAACVSSPVILSIPSIVGG